MKCKFTLILALIFCSIAVSAQKNSFIRGKVVDEKNVPITGAVVRNLNDPTTGAISDANGFFHFYTDDPAMVLTTMMGFLNDTIRVDEPKGRELKIKLKEDPKMINAVVINANTYTVVAGNYRTIVLDYLISDFIYVLTETFSKYALQVYNPINNTLRDSFPLVGFSGEKLFLDCFKNIHIIGDSVVKQVYYNAFENKLEQVAELKVKQFEQLIKPCKISEDDYLTYETFDKDKHLFTYTAVSKERNERRKIFAIQDTLGAKVSAYDMAMIIQNYMMRTPPSENLILLGLWDGNAAKIGTPLEVTWYRSISTKMNPSNVFRMDSSYYFFDNTNFRLSILNMDYSLRSQKPTLFADVKGWKELVVTNESYTVYSHRQFRGVSYFTLVDPVSGQVTGTEHKLKYHIFPDKLGFWGNRVYYLNRNGTSTMKLISQYIEDPGND